MYQKTFLFIASLAALASSCSIKEPRTECLTPVTVHVNDFQITVDSFSDTKATNVNEYDNIKAVTLAFYDGETEVYKSTQLQADPGYGDFSLNLPLGTYTMVVLGYSCYEGDVLSLSSPTLAEFTAGHVGETFSYTEEITISDENLVELSATLDRIVTKLYVVSSDYRPEGVDKIRMTFGGGSKAFNPSTGLATSDTGFSNTVNISTAVGNRSGSISYLFLNTAEETMDISIDALDSEDEVVYHKELRNVPFKMNRSTKVAGKLYITTAPGSTSFQVNADWLTETTVNF